MTRLLLTACLLLGALVAGQWWLWPAEPPAPPPLPAVTAGAGETAGESLPEFRLPPLLDYQEIEERPLFAESRRPPEAAAVAASKPAPPPVARPLPKHLALTGILMTRQGPTALVRDAKARETLRLNQGSDVAGWRIASILPDRLVLTQGRQRQEMLLRIFDASPPPPPSVSRSVPTAQAKKKARRKAKKKQ